MRNAVPVENLLLLLRSDAVVLVKEIEKRAFGFLEGRIGAGFQVAQVGEDAFLELLRVLDRAAEGLESEGKASYDVSARDVEEVIPESRISACSL